MAELILIRIVRIKFFGLSISAILALQLTTARQGL